MVLRNEKVEEQRLQHHAATAEEAAKKKVKKVSLSVPCPRPVYLILKALVVIRIQVKEEMRNQLQGLADTQLKMEKAACLTEAFAEEVDKVLFVPFPQYAVL